MSPAADADVAVIGAGVVGLACAAALARAGRSVMVFERGTGIAQETTSRNSEVVHAGIYYPKDSLKAQLCVEGRVQLYERCERLGIPHRKVGKWIVASSDDEVPRLEGILERGRANGVPLETLEGPALAEGEPDLLAVAAVVSKETGIVDAHALSLSFQAEAEQHEAVLLLRHEVVGLGLRGGAWEVELRGPEGEASALRCGAVVNCAGLQADRVAAWAGVDPDAAGYRLHPCKGDYFALAAGSPVRVSRLIYPLPVQAGLGVHATIDLGGRIRFGPDTEYVSELQYRVDAAKAADFARAVSRYLPGVGAEDLTPDYAGIRPKLAGPGEEFRDFVVCEESERGAPGLVSCIGIESPGLTASPAIGERVASLLASL